MFVYSFVLFISFVYLYICVNFSFVRLSVARTTAGGGGLSCRPSGRRLVLHALSILFYNTTCKSVLQYVLHVPRTWLITYF